MYIVIEVHRHDNVYPPIPRIKGKYDVYVTPAHCLGAILQEFSEEFDPCQGVRLTLTLQDWSKEQVDSFLESVR